MNVQSIDWSAIAAWIAVIISIIGVSVGPLFPACINNKHQLKLRKLDIEEKKCPNTVQDEELPLKTFFLALLNIFPIVNIKM